MRRLNRGGPKVLIGRWGGTRASEVREVTLTSIDEPVVVLLKRLVRVTAAAKLNSRNTKRTAVLRVLELALVSRSNGRLEQFLEKGEAGQDT